MQRIACPGLDPGVIATATGRAGRAGWHCASPSSRRGRTSAASLSPGGSVRKVLQKALKGVGHGKVVKFEITNPVEGRCHDQVEDRAGGRGCESVAAVGRGWVAGGAAARAAGDTRGGDDRAAASASSEPVNGRVSAFRWVGITPQPRLSRPRRRPPRSAGRRPGCPAGRSCLRGRRIHRPGPWWR